jgi:O-antigen/teichoic acid export membrane protein
MNASSIQALYRRINGRGMGATILRGSGIVFVITLIGTGLGLAARIGIARLTGVENYGYYAYGLSWLNVLLDLSLLGFDTSGLRFIPVYRSTGQWGLLRGFVQHSFLQVFALSTIFGLLIAGVVLVDRPNLNPDLVITFLLVALLMPINTLFNLVADMLQALKHIVVAQRTLTIDRTVIQLILLGLIFVFVGRDITAPEAMGTYLVATLFLMLIIKRYLDVIAPPEVHTAKTEYQRKEWNRVSYPIFLQDVLRVLIRRSDVLFLGLFLSTTDAGIYSSVVLFGTLIDFGIIAANRVISPMISELYHNGRKQQLQRLLTIATGAISLYGLATFVGILLFGRWLLGLYGDEFVAGYPALVIIALARLANTLAGPVGYLLNLTNYERPLLKTLIFNAVLSIGLSLILIPRFGMIGAALTTAIATVVWQAMLVYIAQRNMGLNSTVLPIHWIIKPRVVDEKLAKLVE